MPGELSRRAFLERSGLAGLSLAGLYALLDGRAVAPARAAIAASALPPEQHLMQGLRVITDDGVKVSVPPMHHEVITAELTVGRSRRELADARHTLESAARAIELRYPPSPAGLALIIAWGSSYFGTYVPRAGGRSYPDYLPIDRVASQHAGGAVPAFEDTQRFPSDPSTLHLERNDVAFVFQSDSRARIDDEAQTFLKAISGVVRPTSVRRGFVGGGFSGETSLPKQMATEAGIVGADLIPEHAQLFLGFTSTQESALGPDRIANFETLPGFTDQWPSGYFRSGTTMHLSHLYEDVDVWYRTNYFSDRVWLATDLSRAANNVGEGTLTLPEGPANVQSEALVEQFATDPQNGLVGHSASMQPVNRLAQPLRDNYDIERPQGTAILQRNDFNTLDNPFFWTSRPSTDGHSETPAAGVHFIAFSPTSDFFRRLRLSMDGRYADGMTLPIPPRSPRMGLNGVIATTHRQNYLVPPRRHRSFPLSELA